MSEGEVGEEAAKTKAITPYLPCVDDVEPVPGPKMATLQKSPCSTSYYERNSLMFATSLII